MNISWYTKTFNELTTLELFNTLKLRQSVFIVEQECPYPDIDEVDQIAMHLFGVNNHSELIAYARLIKPGVSYRQASIGRVVISNEVRGQRLGEQLMRYALREMNRLYPKQAIKIGAQERLEKFYCDLGFTRTSSMYLEDDIPHIHMEFNY